MEASPLDPVRGRFRAVVETVVPEARELGAGEWTALEAIVEGALLARPKRLQSQLRLFLHAIDLLPLLRYGRRFVALDEARRKAVLDSLQEAPLLLLRRGFWGLRTLAFMGYYARTAAAQEIGYRADPRGWQARV